MKNEKSNLDLISVINFLNENKDLFFIVNGTKNPKVKQIANFKLRTSQTIQITTN